MGLDKCTQTCIHQPRFFLILNPIRGLISPFQASSVTWPSMTIPYEYLHSQMLPVALPFFSPVKGTKSSLSFCSKASFSRYMRRCSRSNGPVAAFCVWSFCRNPAGSSALWQDRGVSRKQGVCLTDTCYLPYPCCVWGDVGVSWGLGLWYIFEAPPALTFCAETGAPGELRQNTHGWSSLSPAAAF